MHIGKIIPRVNWKVAIEAFLEALHIPATHPQVMTSTSDLNSQYDLRQDRPQYSRLLFLSGVPSPLLGKRVSEQQILDSLKLQLGRLYEDLALPPGKTARAGTMVPLERRAQYRFDAARAIDEAWQAGNTVIAASGGTAIFLDNPLQRAVRDLLAIRVHPADNLGSASRSYGRLAFGLENQDLFL